MSLLNHSCDKRTAVRRSAVQVDPLQTLSSSIILNKVLEVIDCCQHQRLCVQKHAQQDSKLSTIISRITKFEQ